MTVLGIDLGTSAVRVGALEEGNARLLVGAVGEMEIPSVVSFAGGVPSVGRGALALAATDPESTLRGFKRHIQSGELARVSADPPGLRAGASMSFDAPSAASISGAHPRHVGAAAAALLEHAVSIAREQVEAEVTHTLLAHPHDVEASDLSAWLEVARSAGLANVALVPEPVACAVGVCQPGPVRPVVIVEVGASHVAASVLEVAEGIEPSLLMYAGAALGGDDVDRALVDLLFRGPRARGFDAGTEELLRQCAETLKRDLSSAELTSLPLPQVVEARTGTHGPISFTRERLEDISANLLLEIDEVCRRARRVLWEPQPATELYVTGGMGNLPFVRTRIEGMFGVRATTNRSPAPVALGAAQLGGVMRGRTSRRAVSWQPTCNDGAVRELRIEEPETPAPSTSYAEGWDAPELDPGEASASESSGVEVAPALARLAARTLLDLRAVKEHPGEPVELLVTPAAQAALVAYGPAPGKDHSAGIAQSSTRDDAGSANVGNTASSGDQAVATAQEPPQHSSAAPSSHPESKFQLGSGALKSQGSPEHVLRLPIARRITARDLDPISLPVLLLVLEKRRASGLLVLRGDQKSKLRVPVLLGRPSMNESEVKLLAEFCCNYAGSFSFNDSDPRLAPGQKPRRALALIGDGIRRASRQWQPQDFLAALGRHVLEAPLVDARGRREIERFGLTPLEMRTLETAFDGTRSSRVLVEAAGAQSSTVRTLLAFAIVGGSVVWKDLS